MFVVWKRSYEGLDMFVKTLGSGSKFMNKEVHRDQSLPMDTRKRLEMILQKEILFILQVGSFQELTICRRLKYIWNTAGEPNSRLTISRRCFIFIILMYENEIECDVENIGI